MENAIIQMALLYKNINEMVRAFLFVGIPVYDIQYKLVIF
jgi:hypothetical protein